MYVRWQRCVFLRGCGVSPMAPPRPRLNRSTFSRVMVPGSVEQAFHQLVTQAKNTPKPVYLGARQHTPHCNEAHRLSQSPSHSTSNCHKYIGVDPRHRCSGLPAWVTVLGHLPWCPCHGSPGATLQRSRLLNLR